MTQSDPVLDAKIIAVKNYFTEISLDILKLYADDDLYNERMLALGDVIEGFEQNVTEQTLNQKIDIFYQKMAEISENRLSEFYSDNNSDYRAIQANQKQYADIEQEFTAIKKQRLAGVLVGGLILAGIAGALALVVAFPALLLIPFNPLTLGIAFCMCIDNPSNHPRKRDDDNYGHNITLNSILDDIFCFSFGLNL